MKSSKSTSRDNGSLRLSILDMSWLVVGGFPQTWERQTGHRDSDGSSLRVNWTVTLYLMLAYYNEYDLFKYLVQPD